MQPFSLCPPEHLRSLRGVLTDIDDTLTAEGSIAPAALAALQALNEAGLPVIAITGRPSGWSEPFALAWPVRAIVAENGAVMLRREAAELRLDFSQDEPTRSANFARLRACAADVLRRVPGACLATDSAGRLTDIAVDHSEFARLDETQIEAVCAVMREHGLVATVSSIHINGWIGEHNKWTAAQWAVQSLLGEVFEPGRWLYIGDSTNDQQMFERMPLSIGVANIARFLPALQHLPSYVTEAERGDGFAEVAKAILGAKNDL
ncbi:HAD-IIB family hydrolase [Roseateles oligotrophus]|uniref:HAD-IIB family hydrolase n=1 Tax=Roseateles oligotrophus TaxID=1769250 RepID=A0ABT2YHM6_9BURK|nr:HAD-IIB family hydrolase [Roseateles oligotrophus]MCV2369561.1 HAD-IIB family hydrolase [Roseateles oligotrophus]